MYPRIRIVLLLLVGALGVPASASAEVVLRRMVYGELTEDRFGGGLAPAGDADGDGSPDFAIIANRGAHGQSGPRDRYYVVSGSDLRLIRRIEAAAPFNEFYTVSAVGDWDDDGEDDLFVREDGELSVRRGRTGERLHVFPSAELSHGERVVAVGDMNGDAVPDLAIGDWSAMNPDGVRTGRVDLISGADYTTIRTLYGERADDEFGFGVGGGCDVNADGASDVFVGAPGFDHSILGQTFDLLDAGKAYVYSGADGSLLHVSLGDWTDDRYSRAFSCVGDVEGDGFEDFMIGNPGFSFFPLFPDVTFQGSARLYSGKTSALLRGFTPNPEIDPIGRRYGGVIVALGDFDGAGETDVLISADDGPFEIRTARTGELLARVESPFPQAGAGFGDTAAFLGPVGAEGRPAIAVGARLADLETTRLVGAVLIYEWVPEGEPLCPGDTNAAALLLGTALKQGEESPVPEAVLCLRTLAGLAAAP